MATSLVSTGVQFPDSTIQTTAATGSPSMAADGSTIYNIINSSAFAYASTAGSIYGSTNILTTAPTLLAPNMEITAGLYYNPSVTTSAYSGQSNNWGGFGYYGGSARMQYDHYAGRFVATLYLSSGSQIGGINVYSTDGVTWYPFRNAYLAGYRSGNTLRVPAFNKYTGTKCVTFNQLGTGWVNSNISTYSAANAYDENASAQNTYQVVNSTYYCQAPSFIDTGTQSTSGFYVVAYSSTYSVTYVAFSSAVSDGASWTLSYLGDMQQGSRVIGTSAELMFYCYNRGVMRSLNNGASWNNYNFINSSGGGTSSGSYWLYMAWNGSYWLGISPSINNGLVTKAMGSGTSWTYLSNLGGLQQLWIGVAWNPTLGCWLAIRNNGIIYSNTSSDPNAGTWTEQRFAVGYFGNDNNAYNTCPMYVKAASTFNF